MSVPKKSGGIYSWQRIQTVQTKIHFHLMQMNRTETLTRIRHLRTRTAIRTLVLIRTAATVLTKMLPTETHLMQPTITNRQKEFGTGN